MGHVRYKESLAGSIERRSVESNVIKLLVPFYEHVINFIL